MSTSSRFTGLLAAGALGLAGMVGLSAAPAHAASTAALGSSEVTLFLKAPHPAALARLASRPITSRPARLAQLAKLVPSGADRRGVIASLESRGLVLEHQTTWSVTAAGPAATIAGLFGTRASGSSVAHAIAAGPLPKVPAALASRVAAAFPTTGGPAAFHPNATSDLSGADFRNADTPAGIAPSTGANDSGVTVATLQLSTVPASDITHYASEHSLTDPVANGNYKAITIDGGPSVMDSAGENSVEVDLDQESILSTAPTAHQQAYYAPNTNAGFNDVFSHVYDDVTGNAMATAPNPHIVSLSSSWGECEGETGAPAIKVLDPILQSVVAAGVTIFASSGDDGIYDCRSTDGTGDDNSQADVDYPASSPSVISTGGTALSADTSTPNTGSNWTEKTWSCATPGACQNSNTGTGGGGGGASGSAKGHSYAGTLADFAGFPMPVWQTRTLTGIYAKSPTRLVPDIAADGDPSTGFNLYTSLGTGLIGSDLQVGGTSLSAPISAAQLANTLADLQRTTGVGDIHPALYSALVKTSALPVTSQYKPFRDVTVGTIGADADKGTDPSVSAAAGYDTTSGVGGVLWSAMTPFLLNTAAPVTKGLAFLHHSNVQTPKVEVGFRWYTQAGKDKFVFDTTTVKIFEKGAKTNLFKIVDGTTYNGYQALMLARGKTYQLTVQATDIGGHVSTLSTTSITVPPLKHG